MKISDIPEKYRNAISISYVVLVFFILAIYSSGVGERYGRIIFYCFPLFAVSCLLKYCLMKDLVEGRVVLALFSAFSVIVLPIEVGLRSLLSPDDNSNNKFGQILTYIGIISTEYSKGNGASTSAAAYANFIITIMILMDVAFLILQLHLLATHMEELTEENPNQVQAVRDPIAQVGSTRRVEEDLTPLLEDGEFSQEFVERMKCPICVDRLKQQRCQSCKQGMCAVCVAQIEESQPEPNCPMCRKPLRTEDLVLCRL